MIDESSIVTMCLVYLYKRLPLPYQALPHKYSDPTGKIKKFTIHVSRTKTRAAIRFVFINIYFVSTS